MESVLVTGGSGFIGSHTVRALAERGNRVIIYDVVPPRDGREWLLEPVRDRVEFVEGQIIDMPTLISTVKAFDVRKVCHLAAIFRPLLEMKQPYHTFRVAEEGTINVLEAARITDLERVVFASTEGVYGPTQYEPLDEKHPTCPSEPYSVSKRAGELWGMSYYTHNKVDFVALRPTAVYGFGRRSPGGYAKLMVENAAEGIPKTYSAEDLRRLGGRPIEYYMETTYVYVKDVAHANLLALDAENAKLKSRIYNIGSGEQTHLSELAETVEEVSGIKVKLAHDLSAAKNIPSRPRVSIELARKELGYVPRYGLRGGVADYMKDYRAYLRQKESK